MSGLKEQKCPGCGAAMRYDPELGKMICDYCGTVLAIQPVKPGSAAAQAAAQEKPQQSAADVIEGFDFASMTDHASVVSQDALPVYTCVSCGADLVVTSTQSALTCPFCGNNITLTGQLSGRLRPDGVIPFRISPKELPAAVNRFYKGKKLLPKGFFSESTMGEVTGVYVPFWVFNGRLSGRLSYTGYKARSHRSGDYIITETDYYRLTRDAQVGFADLPVDASGRVEDKLMDSLEPFRLQEMVPYDPRYLAGFTADRYDVAKSDIESRAGGRMQNSALSVITPLATAGYTSTGRSGGRLSTDLTAKYVLFPVYMFDLTFKGRNYHFAVNGQTGKVVGDLPTDKDVSFVYFLKRAAIVGGALVAYSVVRYFLGY